MIILSYLYFVYLLLLPNISYAISSVPMPEITIFGVDNGSELYFGSSLSLICSVQLQQIEYVDTPITIVSSWDTPMSEHDMVKTNNSYIVNHEINTFPRENSGPYTCKASVHVTNESIYVVESQKQTRTYNITITSEKIERNLHMTYINLQISNLLYMKMSS